MIQKNYDELKLTPGGKVGLGCLNPSEPLVIQGSHVGIGGSPAKELDVVGHKNYDELTSPDDFLAEIDSQWFSAKKKGLERLSTEWGLWSRAMNLRLKHLTEKAEKPNEKAKYVLVLAYWVVRSKMLDMYFTKLAIIKKGKLRRLKKEASEIKKAIAEKGVYSISEADLTKLLLGK